LWQKTLGSQSELAADGDDNGTVDAGDLAVWRENFGAVASAAAAGSVVPVPEPSSAFVLVAVAGLVVASLSDDRKKVTRINRRWEQLAT
jgi:hypothetical protein